VIGEEIARLNAVERVWWPRVLEGEGEALDRWLALQRERVKLRGLVPGGSRLMGISIPGPGELAGLPPGSTARVRVEVEYVDDWRAARAVSAGELVLGSGGLGSGEGVGGVGGVGGDEAEA
jgi:hypothetical protein